MRGVVGWVSLLFWLGGVVCGVAWVWGVESLWVGWIGCGAIALVGSLVWGCWGCWGRVSPVDSFD